MLKVINIFHVRICKNTTARKRDTDHPFMSKIGCRRKIIVEQYRIGTFILILFKKIYKLEMSFFR